MPKKENFFDPDSYQRISIANLILFVIYSASEKKESLAPSERKQAGGCAFEKLIKECFVLFPKSFGFLEHPQWPDSRKLDRPLRFLRKKGLIVGDPKTFFSLTKNGKRTAQEIVKTFSQRKLFK